jgi:hypothetical protein
MAAARGSRQKPLIQAVSAGTERAGFEPAMEFNPHTRLAGECLQPLGHLSWRSSDQCKASALPRIMGIESDQMPQVANSSLERGGSCGLCRHLAAHSVRGQVDLLRLRRRGWARRGPAPGRREDRDAARARGWRDIWLAGLSGVHQFCSYRGSIMVMATQKRSISFDESVLHEAELRIAESGGNLSAFVNGALLRELQVARGRELLAEDDAEFGVVPAEVATQVLAEWPA